MKKQNYISKSVAIESTRSGLMLLIQQLIAPTVVRYNARLVFAGLFVALFSVLGGTALAQKHIEPSKVGMYDVEKRTHIIKSPASVSVQMDSIDYHPGTTAKIKGGGFLPNETIKLQVLFTDGTPSVGDSYKPWTVTADPKGNFKATWDVHENDRGHKLVTTAKGLKSFRYTEISFTDATALSSCFINPDASYTSLPATDDGAVGPISLPFTFSLYGTSYTSVYINNNGNISFGTSNTAYTSGSFPNTTPMIAPFWADVDTRSGTVAKYKVFAHKLIVTWAGVGYYNNNISSLDSFQLIISDGADSSIGIGSNVAFYYGKMNWTTGDASSGSGGFGGTPATVGINAGDNVRFLQIGRFGLNSSVYTNSTTTAGVHYLDYTCYTLNVASATNIKPTVTSTGLVSNRDTVVCGATSQFILSWSPPEADQTVFTTVDTGTLCNVTIVKPSGFVASPKDTVTIVGASCNIGSHTMIVTANDNYGGITKDTITVVVIPFKPLPTSNSPVCVGSNINLTSAGGLSGLSYSWTGPNGFTSTLQNPSVTGAVALSAGKYKVTVTSAGGCSSIDSVTVVVNALPTITAGAGVAICNGNTTSITASGGTSYSWAPSTGLSATTGTTVTAGPSSTTIYTITGTNAAGCINTFNKTVTVNALPAVGAGAGVGICTGSSTAITATGASTYTWTPSTGLSATTGATVNANPSTTTVYTVTGVAATGCSNTSTKTVTVNAYPVITAGAGVTVCNGSTVALTASGGATYSWSPATGLSATTGSTVNAGPTTTQIYTITGTSGAGCSATTTKAVTVNAIPTVSVGSAAAICAGASTSTITASGASFYSWAPATGLSSTTAAGIVASPSSTTTYTVTGTAANGCINAANVTVTVNPLPVIDAGAGVAICTGASTGFSASGAATYSWAPATALSATTGASITASPATTTTYTVTGTSAAGCVATASKTVSVSLLSVGAAPVAAICNGATAVLSAIGGVNYSWTPSTSLSATTGSSISASPSSTTVYTVTVNNGSGCSNTATVMVSVNALPSVTVTPGTTICNGSSATLTASGASTYTWSPSASLSVSTGSSVSASPTSAASYTVTGFSSAGCTNTATVTLSVSSLPTVTSVGTTGAICTGNSLGLTSAASGGSGTIAYSWAGPNSFTSATQNPTIAPATTLASGVYTVTATDGLGCAASAVTTATVSPMANAGTITGASGVCIGSTITLSNTATGVWSVNNSIATIGSATGVVTGVSMGSVIVTYSATNAYACNTFTTKVISVNGMPQYIYTLAGTGTNATTGDNGPSYLASLQGPRAMASDTLGNLYICDVVANIIRKISVDGMITTVAGNGATGTAGDGGQATAAQLSMAGGGGICVDKAGNLFIVNTAVSTIRKVTASTGIISTIAGTGVAGYSGDGGAATAAKINVPLGICQDTAGNIYFADQGNYRIRKIAATTGIISTIVGTGSNSYYGDGGPGTAARVSVPRDVTADKSGNIYIVDNGNNVIRKYVISTGIITTMAGNATAGSGGDGGLATAAQFNCPARIAFDGANGLYVADQVNNKIRQINLATGIITTVVANGTSGFSGDGGPSLSSKIWSPAGIAFNKKGNLFIADANNRRVRVAPLFRSISIALSGSTTLIAGSPVVLNATSSVVGSNVSYQWQKNGANVGTGGATYTNSTPASGDVYKCVLIVTPDCGSVYSDTSNSITVTILGARQNNTTSVTEDVENNVTIKTYPNPVHGQLTIEANGIENGTASISIMDQMGRVVLTSTTEVSNNQMSQQVDMQTLATGMYLVSITDASGKSKVVKCVKN